MRHAPLARRTALLLSPRGPASPQPRLQPPRPLASAPPHPRTDRLAAGMATTPEPHAAGPAAPKPPADAEAHVPPPAISRQLLSVAPMLDWTDVHYRQLARLISRRTWLYTEMVVDQTVLHTAQPDRHLWFPPEQHPVVLQLGGSKPELMAAAARIAARYGYDEINLNCGCPRCAMGTMRSTSTAAAPGRHRAGRCAGRRGWGWPSGVPCSPGLWGAGRKLSGAALRACSTGTPEGGRISTPT